MRVDLNCDVGESFGAYTIGDDEALLGYVTSANIACGFHGGDPAVMDRTVKLALRHGVAIGAHPGYPDLLGFGRRVLDATPEEVEGYVLYQLGALAAFARANGSAVRHVKAHGALYNVAANDLAIARAIARAAARFDNSLILVALAGSQMVAAAHEQGLRVAEEVFADRGYRADGTLLPRNASGALIDDPRAVTERAVRMVRDGTVLAQCGTLVRLRADTICLHGDNPTAPALAAALVVTLDAAGIARRPMADFL